MLVSCPYTRESPIGGISQFSVRCTSYKRDAPDSTDISLSDHVRVRCCFN
jgi:hypothetical protein